MPVAQRDIRHVGDDASGRIRGAVELQRAWISSDDLGLADLPRGCEVAIDERPGAVAVRIEFIHCVRGAGINRAANVDESSRRRVGDEVVVVTTAEVQPSNGK